MNVSAGAEDKPWREPKDDVIQIGKQRSSRTEEVRDGGSPRELRHAMTSSIACPAVPMYWL